MTLDFACKTKTFQGDAVMNKFSVMWPVAVLVLGCAAGCSSGQGERDVLTDVVDASPDADNDAADTDVTLDADLDTAVDGQNPGDIPDVPVDGIDPDATDTTPITHEFVYEIRTRDSCVADGPWTVDRVRQFRDSSSGFLSLDVRAIAVSATRVWVGAGDGVYSAARQDLLADGAFVQISSSTVPVVSLALDGENIIFAAATDMMSLTATGEIALVGRFPAPISHVLTCNSDYFAVAGGLLYKLVGGEPELVALRGDATVVHAAVCMVASVVMGTDKGVLVDGVTPGDTSGDIEGAVTSIASNGVVASTGIASADSNGSDLAIYEYGKDPNIIKPGVGALPSGDVVDVAVSHEGDKVAIAHAIGVTLFTLNTSTFEHFTSARWIPSNTVTDVAFDPVNGDLWVTTPAGVSRLYKEEITLESKAEEMMANLDRWFWRLDGFVSANANFEDAFSDEQGRLWDDDNDGQWTQEAVGAFCYAYRVTGDERYYQAARKAITNMGLQIDIPAQDFIDAGLGRGFITRSFVRDDEGGVFSTKADEPNWHHVNFTDGHEYYWKDDTSSDEVDGHFYGFSIYYDLCAKDDAERAWVGGYLTDLVGYMVNHGYNLLDLDGLPTEHAQYSPDVLAIAVDGLEACTLTHEFTACIDAWGGGAFLNSLQILGGLLAAWHVSGEQRFYDAYESLITEYRYDEIAMFNEYVATWTSTAIANYCDHELADLAFLTLIRYEPNKARRDMWIKSMVDAWQYEVGERNPLKSLAMAAAIAETPGLANGVRTLVEYPEDTRQYLVDNSHRKDVGYGGKDRFQEPQFDTVLPYDEIQSMRWDGNPYRIVGGGSPQQRRAPNFWLLPYWGLRYYNAICAE
jgi:hypothetical protein